MSGFPQRIIPTRQDEPEIFENSQENILQKTNVSNLIGLLSQLNKVSLYAHEIFNDVLQTTKQTGTRIKSAKQRINNLQTRLPKIETMLISSAPNVFYDNPFPGKEYLRDDPLNGLLFTRSDASSIVNRRRDEANPPTNMSQMDHIDPQKVPCIKKFSDADFFINEWLENEKRKREEDRERRRQMRANRKRNKVKRKENKTIQKLQRKHWDEHGNEIKNDNEPTEIVVTQYVLTDDTNRNFNALLKSNKQQKASKRKSQKVKQEEIEQNSPNQPPPNPSQKRRKHEPVVSYVQPNQPMKQSHVSVLSNGNGPPPNPLQLQQSRSDTPPEDNLGVKLNVNGGPPPNPMQMMNGPPPNPLKLEYKLSNSQRTESKLRALSSSIPKDDALISNEIPDDAMSPPQIYATKYQKRDLEKEAKEQMNLSDASQIIASSPKQVSPVPPTPKLGFLNDIQSFKDRGQLKKTQINVNRHKPKDKRTNLIDQIKNNNLQLSSVNLRKVKPKKKEKKNLIFEAMELRRKHFDDSSDEEESDWGSDSD